MPLVAADKTIICSAGQASLIVWCWSLSNSLMGLYWRIWLTYNGCQMICIWPKSGVQKLHFYCHYEYTMWIFYQFLFYKGAVSTDISISVSCILGMSVLSFILLFCPYVSMGIGAQKGQLPARWTMSSLLTVIIGRYKHQRLSHCLSNKSQDSSMMVFLVIL